MKAFGSKAFGPKLRASRQYAQDLEGSLRDAQRGVRALHDAASELSRQIAEAERKILRLRAIHPRGGMCFYSTLLRQPGVYVAPDGSEHPYEGPLLPDPLREWADVRPHGQPSAEAGRVSCEPLQAEIDARRAADLGRVERRPTWEDFSK